MLKDIFIFLLGFFIGNVLLTLSVLFFASNKAEDEEEYMRNKNNKEDK